MCMFHVERERDRVSDREDVRDLQTISLICWCNRHIFQDVAACGPRLCLSRMTPFTSIHQHPARPPLTLSLRLCVWGRERGTDRFERSDGMSSAVGSLAVFEFVSGHNRVRTCLSRMATPASCTRTQKYYLAAGFRPENWTDQRWREKKQSLKWCVFICSFSWARGSDAGMFITLKEVIGSQT